MRVEEWLKRYSEWRTRPPLQFPSPPTVEARIAEMQENAGMPGGVGIKYALLEVDGEVFSCPPDGGLGELCDRIAGLMRADARMREFASLIDRMPSPMRQYIAAGWHVQPREEPRSGRAGAALMGINRVAYDQGMARALGYLEALLVGAGMIWDGGVTAAKVRSDRAIDEERER